MRRLEASEAETLVAEHYGLSVAAISLDSERDQNFHLQSPDGQHYLFKVSNPDEHPHALELQTSALQYLAEVDGHLRVPRVIPASDGSAWFPLHLSDGGVTSAAVLSYLSGILLHNVPPTVHLRKSLGRNLGGSTTLCAHSVTPAPSAR